MAEPIWSEAVDSLVRRARFSDGDSWWDAAASVVTDGLPPDVLAELATLGLMELVTWAHRLDRDPGYPCAGHQAARRRWPETVPPAIDVRPESPVFTLEAMGLVLLDET